MTQGSAICLRHALYCNTKVARDGKKKKTCSRVLMRASSKISDFSHSSSLLLLNLPYSYQFAPLAGKGGFIVTIANPLGPGLPGMQFHSFLYLVSLNPEEDGVLYTDYLVSIRHMKMALHV